MTAITFVSRCIPLSVRRHFVVYLDGRNNRISATVLALQTTKTCTNRNERRSE